MVQQAETASPRRRKHLTDEAIRLAVAGDWKGAAAANSAILDDFADDVEAANRLGKALTELGRTKKAIEAYQRALEIDAFNAIARRNLDRLEAQTSVDAPTKSAGKPAAKAKSGSSTEARVLVSSATAAEFRLQQSNPVEISKLDPGDKATLLANARGVAVVSEGGAILGYIEPKAGLRLKRLIEGGNQYDVKIRAIEDDGHAIVFIRETRRAASLIGQASFLAAAETRKKAPRAYTRRSALIEEDEPDLGVDNEDEDPLGELREVADVEDLDEDDDEANGDISNELDSDSQDEEADPADVDDEFEGDDEDDES